MSCGTIRNGQRCQGGGDPTIMTVPDFDVVGATTTTVPLATLAANGNVACVRGLTLIARFVAGVPAGDIGQAAFAGAVQCQRGTTDAQVVVFAVAPWGPPPAAVLQPNSVGYQPPMLFGVGGVPVVLQATGSQLEIAVTGIAGFTIRFSVRGNIDVLDGAVRLVA